ncbi:hypothetical protein MUK42_08991 [Musa troglodytarum]|uniref:Uncharacterized protein n=1 Tax=Musa troglodytarum TaxID=320322 RepID=A0A9E7JC00_9LILI|nr:hypothetical protein MUK42_08991 [Musa troglodytarum]
MRWGPRKRTEGNEAGSGLQASENPSPLSARPDVPKGNTAENSWHAMHGTERLRGKETRLSPGVSTHRTQSRDRLSCRLYIRTERWSPPSSYLDCSPSSSVSAPVFVIDGERRNSQLHRDSSRHHPSSARRLPQLEFWICLLLTLFGYLPGIIYAVYAITK